MRGDFGDVVVELNRRLLADYGQFAPFLPNWHHPNTGFTLGRPKPARAALKPTGRCFFTPDVSRASRISWRNQLRGLA